MSIDTIKDSTCLAYQYRLRKKRKLKFAISYKVSNLASLFSHIISEARPTYYVDTGKIQCEANRYRSARDMYLTCLHYFPNITYRQFYDALTFVGDNCIWGDYGYCEEAEGKTFRFSFVRVREVIKALKNNEQLNYKNPDK